MLAHGEDIKHPYSARSSCVLAEHFQQAVAPAQLLSSLLDLDHRAVQPHLQKLWQLVWTAASQDSTLSPGGCGCCPGVHNIMAGMLCHRTTWPC